MRRRPAEVRDERRFRALSNTRRAAANAARRIDPITEPRAVRWILTGIALLFLALFLVVPLVAVFYQALSKGLAFTSNRWPIPTRCPRSS